MLTVAIGWTVADMVRGRPPSKPLPAASPSLPLGFVPPAPDELIAAYRRQLGPEGHNPLVLVRLADAYVAKARAASDPAFFELAKRAAREADRAGEPAAKLVLARVALAHHNFAEASRLLAAAGPDPEAAGLRFDLAMALGDLPAAKAELGLLGATGVALVRHALYLDLTGEEARADQAFAAGRERLLKADPEARAWAAVSNARALLRQGRPAPAALRIAEAEAVLPGYVPAVLADAERLRLAGDWRAVRARLAPLAPQGRPDVLTRLGQAERVLGAHADGMNHQARATAALVREGGTNSPGHRADYARWMLVEGTDTYRSTARTFMLNELKVRGDLDTRVLAAEACVLAGDPSGAMAALAPVLAGPVKDARAWYWAARSEAARGHTVEAERWRVRAKTRLPALEPEAREWLARAVPGV